MEISVLLNYVLGGTQPVAEPEAEGGETPAGGEEIVIKIEKA